MMDERERRDIMLRAIHRYGEAAQIDMAVEEMAELTKALCKVKRATPGATTTAAVSNVIEEIADVQIMLDQLRLIFARSTDEVEEDKLRRLLGRLNSYAESNLHEWLHQQYKPGRGRELRDRPRGQRHRRRLPATLGHLPAGRPLQERRPSS